MALSVLRRPIGFGRVDLIVMASIDRPGELTIEVFADITCPFTHVGLKRVMEHVASMDRPASVWVRSWPLEWVNGVGLDAGAVAEKAATLTEQLGVDDFGGFDAAHWPSSTLPALELAAAAYDVDMEVGLAVSLELRNALFERGQNVGDPAVLEDIGAAHGELRATDESRAIVQSDYDEGQRRGVAGSPHFWVDDDDFFCPALDLGHDDTGHLTARFDPTGLANFFARIGC